MSDTRWCARADATKALSKDYKSFQKALQSIADNKMQTLQVILEVRCLLKDSEKTEYAVISIFLAALLDQINGVSKTLQKLTIELRAAVDLIKSLLDFLLSQQDLFDDYELKAIEISDTEYCDENQRLRKRKRHHDDRPAEEILLRGREKLKIRTYLPVIDVLYAELSRLKTYQAINSLFGFLTDLLTKSNEQIKEACLKFLLILFRGYSTSVYKRDGAVQVLHLTIGRCGE